MNFQQAIAAGFRNYVNFSGRAARAEFWYWILFVLLVGAGANILDAALFPANPVAPLNALVNLAFFLPGLSIGVRRLHDIDRSGWWVLIAFTIVGIIPLIVWSCRKGTNGPNRFGPDPLA